VPSAKELLAFTSLRPEERVALEAAIHGCARSWAMTSMTAERFVAAVQAMLANP